jgi:hypothetical protein
METVTSSRPLFPLGQLVCTRDAMDLMTRTGTTVLSLLRRHSRGDWGEVCESDKQANDRSVTNGTRILSAYLLGAEQEKLWLITEADRSATTALTPNEY